MKVLYDILVITMCDLFGMSNHEGGLCFPSKIVRILNPRSRIPDPESRIHNPGSGIQDPVSMIVDPGC